MAKYTTTNNNRTMQYHRCTSCSFRSCSDQPMKASENLFCPTCIQKCIEIDQYIYESFYLTARDVPADVLDRVSCAGYTCDVCRPVLANFLVEFLCDEDGSDELENVLDGDWGTDDWQDIGFELFPRDTLQDILDVFPPCACIVP